MEVQHRQETQKWTLTICDWEKNPVCETVQLCVGITEVVIRAISIISFTPYITSSKYIDEIFNFYLHLQIVKGSREQKKTICPRKWTQEMMDLGFEVMCLFVTTDTL